MPHPEDPNILVAAEAGCILLRNELLVDVEQIYTVNWDVDYSTGNIDFVGTVVVKGDVKSGFKIKAKGDLDVHGVVEDAELDAEGRILLQKGIVGRERGS